MCPQYLGEVNCDALQFLRGAIHLILGYKSHLQSNGMSPSGRPAKQNLSAGVESKIEMNGIGCK